LKRQTADGISSKIRNAILPRLIAIASASPVEAARILRRPLIAAIDEVIP
jgi:hypothetical protein